MTKYPCPPVGFQFTEENVVQAKAFYAVWLIDCGLCSPRNLYDRNYAVVGFSKFLMQEYLPWKVQSLGKSKHYTFTKTPLPEGETHA